MAVLKLKSRGKDVEALQKALNKQISAKLKTDGEFGKLTFIALKKFQKKNSLKPDGVAGASTLAVLGLGPSLRVPKMKTPDCRKELAYWKSKDSLQSTGGPDHIGREMADVKKILHDIEGEFLAMVAEVKKIQKDVEKHRNSAVSLLEEAVSQQEAYAMWVKKNNMAYAADAAKGAQDVYAFFSKAEADLQKAQAKQQKIFFDRFIPLMDKTFS